MMWKSPLRLCKTEAALILFEIQIGLQLERLAVPPLSCNISDGEKRD